MEEFEEMRDASRRQTYNADTGGWNYGRKRATDVKGNTMVVLPGRRKNFQEEANLEMLRAELKGCFKKYLRENCNDKGEQESNLLKGEQQGLKTLKKKVKEGGIIVLPTDKSGRFAVMSLENYVKAGNKHTDKDEEVGPEIVKKTQTELNGNMSMLIKFFKIGNLWKHGGRIRKNMLNNSLSLCPMYLTFKDHKGWTGEDNSPPPTRPIAGGNTGMNIHLSEVISELIEPLVDRYVDGNEIISTEDLKARIEIINEKNRDWTKWSWWEGKKTECGKFICCTKCIAELSEKLPPSPAVSEEEHECVDVDQAVLSEKLPPSLAESEEEHECVDVDQGEIVPTENNEC